MSDYFLQRLKPPKVNIADRPKSQLSVGIILVFNGVRRIKKDPKD
ncbi:hypothetical protein SynMVIR181_00609 [Synechococcus sp. MVIR-18-1]|nr:hypothetical protein SynMVIR181_00609 [Synechococcus sp. MVIR-18-1]